MLSELLRIARFGLVGGLASATYALAVLVLVDVMAMNTSLASVLAYLLAIPVSFFGQKHFTFGSKASAQGEFARFLVVQGISLVLSLLVMRAVTDWFGWSHRVGILAVIIVIAVVNYGIMRNLVFLGRKP